MICKIKDVYSRHYEVHALEFGSQSPVLLPAHRHDSTKHGSKPQRQSINQINSRASLQIEGRKNKWQNQWRKGLDGTI
jgi:hypothetical protein